jgi:4-hydroxymandelate oxidase
MLDRCVTIEDFEAIARARLPAMTYDYYRSGADDEHTLRRNRDAWSDFVLWYRTLVDVGTPALETTVLGTKVRSPILVAPTAYHGLAHPDAEGATARACAEAGSLYCASTLATTTLEDVAAAAPGGARWFQLYVHRDRDFTMRLVERAKAAKYSAIVVTADTPVLGRRCNDVRNGFGLPPHLAMANLVEILPPDLKAGAGSELARFVASRHDPTFTWTDLRALADACAPLPLVVKGLVRGDDAARALDQGAKAIWVSNHGGRQLDLAPGTAHALVDVMKSIGDRAEVYVDGGIRSGTEALVALGLGARAVFVGRPVLWGLAAGGEAGVAAVLALLDGELERALKLAGCASISAAKDDLVRHRAR